MDGAVREISLRGGSLRDEAPGGGEPVRSSSPLHLVAPTSQVPLSIGILGALEVSSGGDRVPIAAPKQQAVLAALALSAGAVVSTDALVDELWGDGAPRTAANTLQTYVSRLRRVLTGTAGQPQPLRTYPHGYALVIDEDAVDSGRFRRLVASARAAVQTDVAGAHALLVESLSLWRGHMLGGSPLGSVLQPQAELLEGLRHEALGLRLELDLHLGRHRQVVPELRALVTAHPLQERLSELLMTALFRAGRQAEALEVYRSLRAALITELGVEPGRAAQSLNVAVLEHDPGLDAPATTSSAAVSPVERAQGNLPSPLTALIGRDGEVARVGAQVADGRLVTLTGAAGCGKTRVAIGAAESVRATFADGAWFVALAALDEPELVPRTVAAVLGVGERPGQSVIDAIVHFLRPRSTLLVLDNCEHLVGAAAELAEGLLTACPKLRILATSREALFVAGETTFSVPPLPVPAWGAAASPAVAAVPAVEMFIDRARAVRPGFGVTDTNVTAVIRICRDLDGIPLALELAASRLAVLEPDELAARLDDRFRLLVGGSRTALPRHRTLRAAVQWSYDLLNAPAQTLFRRLSVFAGAFTLQAVQDVLAPRSNADERGLHEAVDLLEQLVTASLVTVEAPANGTGRFRLLSTLRSFGRELLKEKGERHEEFHRHATWCLALVRESQVGLRGSDQQLWLDRLASQQDDLRAAMHWALDAHETILAEELAAALWWFWYRTGQVREGYRWTKRVLTLTRQRGGAPPTGLHAAVLHRGAHLAWASGDLDAADVMATESLHLLSDEARDDYDRAEALAVLGLVAQVRNEVPAASRLLGRSLAYHRQAGDTWSIATAAVILGVHLFEHGEQEDARALIDESLERFSATGDPFGIGWARWAAGRLTAELDDPQAAIAHLLVGIETSRAIGHPIGVGLALIGLADCSTRMSELLPAARLMGAASALADAIGVPLLDHYGSSSCERILVEARRHLGAQGQAAALTEGRQMSMDEAIAYALTVVSGSCPDHRDQG